MATAIAAAPTRILSQKELDMQIMLAAEVHLGTKNCDFQTECYVFKRLNDGIYIINLAKTLEKLQLAGSVVVAIENPQGMALWSKNCSQVCPIHSNAIVGRHTSVLITNQVQTSFSEPRLLILTDPRTDHQVDLFLYREPEETKEQEEEEAAPVADYALPSADYGWQWTAETAPPHIYIFGSSAKWDAAAPQPQFCRCINPLTSHTPAPTGWDE